MLGSCREDGRLQLFTVASRSLGVTVVWPPPYGSGFGWWAVAADVAAGFGMEIEAEVTRAHTRSLMSARTEVVEVVTRGERRRAWSVDQKR